MRLEGPKGATKGEGQAVQSVNTVFRIFEEVAERQPVGVSEVARCLGIPKSTAQRGLRALGELGWLRTDAHAHWTITTKALAVASKARHLDVRARVLPTMHDLQRMSGENVHLAVPDGDSMTLIEKVDSDRAVRTFQRLGATGPIHATATGKAFLSRLSVAELDERLNRGLQSFTKRTITDPDRLRVELREADEQGYAVNWGEWREDVTAVGVALLDLQDRPVAAISISSPAHRIARKMVSHFGEMLRKACWTLRVEV